MKSLQEKTRSELAQVENLNGAALWQIACSMQ